MRLASLAVLAIATGCSVGNSAGPAYPTPAGPAADPSWVGPPGGAIDPGYGYTEAEGSYEGSYPPAEDDPTAYTQPSGDPAAPNYALGDLTDAEMEATLQPYGEWVEDPEYGWIWIPYTTVVGADFTPYDTGGEWAYTADYGWSFDSDFDWGWVAFHFGDWTMFEDSSWGWVPDSTWAPHHCDWRTGDGTVGWRPTPPNIGDHRTGHYGSNWHPSGNGPANTQPGRDRPHGGHKDPDKRWTFAATAEFGLRHRPTVFAPSDALRATTPVLRPSFGARAGAVARPAASFMGNRLRTSAWLQTHPTPTIRPDTRTQVRGTWGGGGGYGQSTGGGRPWMKPPSPWGTGAQRPSYSSGTTWQRPPYNGGTRVQRPPQAPSGSYQSGPLWTRPVTPTRPSVSSGSSGGGWAPSGSRYTPPSRSSWGGSGGYTPPSRPSWSPTSNGAPSRGAWNGGSSYSPPSRPSFSPSSSSSGGSRGGGYSPPSRSTYSPSSSGSSGGSRSSGSYSSGSSGGSRSSGSSSSSSSSSNSSRGSGGGSWRR